MIGLANTHPNSAFHVFAGDETAAAAFGPMLRALGLGARVHGALESASAEHDLPMPGPHELRRAHQTRPALTRSP